MLGLFRDEAGLRDHLALHLIEPALELLKVEYPLDSPNGAGGRFDILARDRLGHVVCIEVKRSDQSARATQNELSKDISLLHERDRVARDINGGGRAEAEAAHFRQVEANGPDIVTSGLALSGTVHCIFDRGLISLSHDLEILVSRQANDSDSVRRMINNTGKALAPGRLLDRPHPHFLAWHREHCFKL